VGVVVALLQQMELLITLLVLVEQAVLEQVHHWL